MINVRGIVFRLHPLFVLMLILSVFAGYFVEMITLFAIVLIHELGHVAAARSFGWHVRMVQLLPFGGVAEVDGPGAVPAREELLVALAGPLQNIWMIVLSMIMTGLGIGAPEWWSYFAEANWIIALFNLMPVLPLDGGKVLLAAVSYVMSYHRALVFCSWLSLVLSSLLVVGAIYPAFDGGVQLNLLLVGLFLAVSNWYGHQHIPFRFVRFLMGRESRGQDWVRTGSIASPIITHGAHSIWPVMQLFMREKYHLIYVLNEKGDIGRVIPEQRLIDTYLRDKKPDGIISDL